MKGEGMLPAPRSRDPVHRLLAGALLLGLLAHASWRDGVWYPGPALFFLIWHGVPVAIIWCPAKFVGKFRFSQKDPIPPIVPPFAVRAIGWVLFLVQLVGYAGCVYQGGP